MTGSSELTIIVVVVLILFGARGGDHPEEPQGPGESGAGKR